MILNHNAYVKDFLNVKVFLLEFTDFCLFFSGDNYLGFN